MKKIIVVPVDLEEQSLIALEQAANIAVTLKYDMQILHVADERTRFKSASAKKYFEEQELEVKQKLSVITQNIAHEKGIQISFGIWPFALLLSSQFIKVRLLQVPL